MDMRLKDIAQKAGVSSMTVSNVINGKTNRVSAETIEKVNTIIKKYGYIPNMSARTLSKKTSNIIGIIITSHDGNEETNYMENPYISTVIGCIEQELRNSGYYIMVHAVSHKDDISALAKNWNVDGFLFLYPDYRKSMKNFLTAAPCPIAIFDNDSPPPGIINVCANDRQGLYLSTCYMITHGHTNIAFVADYTGNPLLTNRFQGYLQALADARIPFREEYVLAYPPTYEGGLLAGREIASSRTEITAAVTTADICAVGVMEGARQGGYRIPVDLSVIGYDNLSLCKYTSPKLTSVSQHIPQKAKLATQLLLEKIKTGTTQRDCHIVMDVEIIERQSVVSVF